MQIYDLQANGTAVRVHNTCTRHGKGNVMYINAYKTHLSYIVHVNDYSRKFQCNICQKHFARSTILKRHRPACARKTDFIYPGGYYKFTPTLFEELEETAGISVDSRAQMRRYFAVFDCEAILKRAEDTAGNTNKLEWTTQHVPISFSIASNVQGHEEAVFVMNTDIQVLVTTLIEELTNIQQTAQERERARFKWLFDQLDQLMEDERNMTADAETPGEEVEEEEDDMPLDIVDEFEDDEVEVSQGQKKKKKKKFRIGKEKEQKTKLEKLGELRGKLEGWTDRLPVFGFNCSR